MSRALLHIVIVGLCLLGIAGCGNSGYDRRLAEADSLMAVSPDSARAVLRAIDAGRLSRADRAYHALLSTQAAYKCFDSIPSTATIDRAVDYFSSGSDREKLTRSLIYKGAVIEDLGNKTEAMRLYKLAEAEADTSDYFNLGYVNLRMAKLYNNEFDVDSTDLKKYKQALEFFKKDGNKSYQLTCLSAIGILSRAINSDTAIFYINKTLELASILKDDYFYYNSLAVLTGMYFSNGQYNEAKTTALRAIRENPEILDDDKCYYYIIRSLIKLDNIDSATIFLGMVDEPVDSCEKVEYYSMMADYYKYKGKYTASMEYSKKASDLAGTLLVESLQFDLKQTEELYNKNTAALILSEARRNILILVLLLATVIIIVLVVFAALMKNKLKIKTQEEQIKTLQLDCQNLININANIDKNSQLQRDVQLQKNMESFLSAIKDISTAKNTFNKIDQDIYDRIRKSLFAKVTENTEFWENLKSYVDKKFGGIITNLAIGKYKLSESDTKMLCLVGCGFSNSSILLLSNYTNVHSISNRKRIIASKLELNGPLENLFFNERCDAKENS